MSELLTITLLSSECCKHFRGHWWFATRKEASDYSLQCFGLIRIWNFSSQADRIQRVFMLDQLVVEDVELLKVAAV